MSAYVLHIPFLYELNAANVTSWPHVGVSFLVGLQLPPHMPSYEAGSSWNRPSLAVVIATLVLSIFTARALYAVFFHPLRVYPGPLLAKVSSAYAAYHALQGDIHLDLQRLHEKYGNVVRYGPNRLVFRSTAALGEIYGYGKPVQKSKSYATMVPWHDGWTVASSIDKELHRNMRRTLTSEMTNSTLRMFEPNVLALLDKLIDHLTTPDADDEKHSPKNMSAWCKYFGIDAMSKLGFGETVGLLENSKSHFVVDIIDWYTVRTGFYEQWPELFTFGLENIVNLFRDFSNSLQRFIVWREEFTQKVMDSNGEAKQGVFSHVMHGSPGSNRYQNTPAQMRAEGAFLVLVGGDTNTAALCAALFYLSRFPNVRAKLEAEIRGAFSDANAISSLPPSPLPSLPYLNAFTTEVLRMCPPTPGVPWREVLPGGTRIDSHWIPAGVDVGICIWDFQRRPDVFRDPNRFWPERWLPGNLPVAELQLAQTCNKPFSIGPRACAGKKVAIMQLQLAVAKLLWHCDVSEPLSALSTVGEGDPQHGVGGKCAKNDFQFDTHFSAVPRGPWLRFARRQTDQ